MQTNTGAATNAITHTGTTAPTGDWFEGPARQYGGAPTYEYRPTKYCAACSHLENDHFAAASGTIICDITNCNCTHHSLEYFKDTLTVSPNNFNHQWVTTTTSGTIQIDSVLQQELDKTKDELLDALRENRELNNKLTTILEQTKSTAQKILILKAVIKSLRIGNCDPEAPCDRIENDEEGDFVCSYHSSEDKD